MALSSLQDFEALKFNDDNYPTSSSEQQEEVEDSCEALFLTPKYVTDYQQYLELTKDRHVRFLRRGLQRLSTSFVCLDASRPWICFWILHSLDLLDVGITDNERHSATEFIKACQNPSGGFGGGPMQLSHLAPTYAAVNVLAIAGTEESYEVVDRKKMYTFLLSLRDENGAFMMHEGGEVDVRGCYCAIAVAKLLKIETPELFKGTAEWIASCQTYEGGMSGCPGLEAHGGYTHCGIAALYLLGRREVIDQEQLLYWFTHRQMRFEGGFQGRTNKLVDGCYTFWVGGIAALLEGALISKSDESNDFMYDRVALQEYVLLLAQHPAGGLKDKPSTSPDYYHTCYVLSGMSACQHASLDERNTTIVGPLTNLLKPIHPAHNLSVEKYERIEKYFADSENIHRQDDCSEL